MDLEGIGWLGVDWTHLAQDSNKWWAFVNTSSIECGEFLD
jgi:hypothetical protein